MIFGNKIKFCKKNIVDKANKIPNFTSLPPVKIFVTYYFKSAWDSKSIILIFGENFSQCFLKGREKLTRRPDG